MEHPDCWPCGPECPHLASPSWGSGDPRARVLRLGGGWECRVLRLPVKKWPWGSHEVHTSACCWSADPKARFQVGEGTCSLRTGRKSKELQPSPLHSGCSGHAMLPGQRASPQPSASGACCACGLWRWSGPWCGRSPWCQLSDEGCCPAVASAGWGAWAQSVIPGRPDQMPAHCTQGTCPRLHPLLRLYF